MTALTCAQVARVLRVDRADVQDLCRTGRIPATKRADRANTYRVRFDDLQQFIQAGRHVRTSDQQGAPMPKTYVTPHPFYAELRKIRNAAGLSLQALEDKTHGQWKAVVVGSYERGDRQPTMVRLDEYLGMYGKRLAIVDNDESTADPVIAEDVRAAEAIRALKTLIARVEATQGTTEQTAEVAA